MQQLDRDERSALMSATPEEVWAVVSDVTRAPDLSPEVSACRWLDGATEPAVGVRFEATNTVNGRSWKNRPVITRVEPGHLLRFERTEPFAGTIAWQWTVTPADGGTHTTVAYEVTRPIRRIGWFVIERIYRAGNRRDELASGMEQSLQRLAQLVSPNAQSGR
ncbi:SRPBCC family protein [Knoellia sp. CPCC 206435]|uniref:SRPBCC family protein n=1 Tax=Knoellia terrae TaxID=3404797 RepID=UPI003B42816F